MGQEDGSTGGGGVLVWSCYVWYLRGCVCGEGLGGMARQAHGDNRAQEKGGRRSHGGERLAVWGKDEAKNKEKKKKHKN